MKSWLHCVVLTTILLCVQIVQAQNDYNLYKKAKNETYNKKWDKAIDNYQELMKKYPESRYADDAHFWIAYLLENKGKMTDSFNEYQSMVKKYPASVWVDDARIHQIFIAEKLIKGGQSGYRDFLRSMIGHEIKNVRYQAAISLGRLKDPTSKLVLNEIANNGDEDLRNLAASLIGQLNTVESETYIRTDIAIKTQGASSQQNKQDENKGLFGWLTSDTRRMKIYEQLNKKGDTWTDLELIVYGLWHILPEAEFNDFLILQSEYDKREWLRKFWKKWDPTPTTPENERQEEFERRIHYAHSKYGQEWNYRHFNFLKKQYLRDGWSMAPWDCRGELYVKYGEPDFKDASRGFQKEIWTYYRYNVDFIVTPYVTNIYSNAIEAGPISKRLYQNYQAYIDAEYIFKPDFKFVPFNDIKPVKHFELEVSTEDVNNLTRTVDVTYEISGSEFNFKKGTDTYEALIRQIYTVYDEDLTEVSYGADDIAVTVHNEKETNAKRQMRISFTMEAPPGYYTFSIRIQDLNSKRLGIFMKEFEVD